jgi:hypothetical protein
VPWCAACDRFLSPSTVRVDGTCPSCGRVVDPGRARHAQAAAPTPAAAASRPAPDTTDDDETPEPLPWHLKLLLVALAIYLSYRALQGVEWLVAHL